jgi:hypothetical protein
MGRWATVESKGDEYTAPADIFILVKEPGVPGRATESCRRKT